MASKSGKTRIVLLGATGSIGTSCLDIVRACPELFEIVAVTAHSSWQHLAKICEEFRPQTAVLTGVTEKELPGNAFPNKTQLAFGTDALKITSANSEADIVISAIVGSAGLHGTWAAVEAGKTVGLANKETLVAAGPLVMSLAKATGSQIIPVDSEHSAIFQALECGHCSELAKVILTASGGPFRTWPKEQLQHVSIEDALTHPNWNMGPKITIDSATMMNKALEVIEARWLFDLREDQISVVVHPQSIVHSMVEFVDGSVMAQLSPPDMKLPIQYALTWPERKPGISPKLDFQSAITLNFEPPDLERFPALGLGFEVASRGGTCGSVLNAANEIAVEQFLKSKLSFTDIPRLCRSILDAHHYESEPTLETVVRLDTWARQEARSWNPLSSHHSAPSLTLRTC